MARARIWGGGWLAGWLGRLVGSGLGGDAVPPEHTATTTTNLRKKGQQGDRWVPAGRPVSSTAPLLRPAVACVPRAGTAGPAPFRRTREAQLETRTVCDVANTTGRKRGREGLT